MFRKAGSTKGPLTPGELDAKTQGSLFLSPGAGAQGQEFVPAYKGSQSRKGIPMVDAYQMEAAKLQDAELDLRVNAKFSQVFGNGLFEQDAVTTPPKTPGQVKRNNLFEDPTRQLDQRKSEQADRDSNPDTNRGLSAVAKRGASMMRTPSNAQTNVMGGDNTVVEAFNMDDSAQPVPAPRTRSVPQPPPSPSPRVAEKTSAQWDAEIKQLISSGHRDEAIRRPALPGQLARCYLRRVKTGFFGGHSCFQMHLDSGDVFLLAGRRRKKSKVSAYVISMDLEDLKRDSDSCVAKLKANFVGTEYLLWGKTEDKAVKKGFGREELCINFKQTALTLQGGPRSMYVALPTPEEQAEHSASGGVVESLSNSLELAKRKELPPYQERKLAMLATKPPEWDESLKAYTLDFKGRVKEASVKNFQLVCWDHNTDQRGSDVVLQFGKVADDCYALDFAYPLSIEHAFSIALASIDTKLCYTM